MIFEIYFYRKYWYPCGKDSGQIINVNTIVKDTQLQLGNMEMVVQMTEGMSEQIPSLIL